LGVGVGEALISFLGAGSPLSTRPIAFFFSAMEAEAVNLGTLGPFSKGGGGALATSALFWKRGDMSAKLFCFLVEGGVAGGVRREVL